MAREVAIALDCLGGDKGPEVVFRGAELALQEDKDLMLYLCGPEECVVPFASHHERCEAVPTTQEISMEEHPVRAVRTKKDSSIVRGCALISEGKAQGFFSAGSTGAVLAAATLVCGRIPGVKRPCLATVAPGKKGPLIFCDIGANVDCKPEYLVQFGQMASVYASLALGVDNPRIGLLNNGTEETKGSKLVQEAYKLLQDIDGFAGNVEATQFFSGDFDVIVSDGFAGNVCIKTIEGTAKYLFSEIKGVFASTLLTKVSALIVKKGLKSIKAKLDPDMYGGAPLLGTKGACIVGHGSSGEVAIKNGILQTARVVRFEVNETIQKLIEQE